MERFEKYQESSSADWFLNQLIDLHNNYVSKIDISSIDNKNKEYIIPLLNGITRLIKGDKS